jgi:xanthine dehydrogenase FAD-binding subunit
MKDFEYAAATTLKEAIGLLAKSGDRARVLTGGTDLLVQLREGLRDADLVVDVKKIPDLMQIAFSAEGGLRLGAGVPCHRVYEDAYIARHCPGLVDAARIIGGWQIQSRASIGGNLCNASPAADSIPILIALGATCRIAGPSGERSLPVHEFCVGPGKNALKSGELLVAIEFPATSPHASSAYERFIPRNEMDIAVVGVGSWLRLNANGSIIEEARIGLGAVAPTPLFAAEASDWLKGKPTTEQAFSAATDLAMKAARPISDKRGPAEYRTHLVGVLTKRTLSTAVDRAKQPS